MNLYDMVADAQHGHAMTNLGRQFGLNEQQSADALRHLLPAFSSGLKRTTETPLDLSAFLNALNGGQHERYYEEDIFADRAAQSDGNHILGHVFGSKDVSRAVADRAAAETGIGADILKAMLPYIASIIMGALFKRGQNPIGDILGEILGGGARRGTAAPRDNNPFSNGDNPFGPLSEILKGDGDGPVGQKSPRSLPKRGTDIFGDMFDADGDGSAMDDIFDSILGANRNNR